MNTARVCLSRRRRLSVYIEKERRERIIHFSARIRRLNQSTKTQGSSSSRKEASLSLQRERMSKRQVVEAARAGACGIMSLLLSGQREEGRKRANEFEAQQRKAVEGKDDEDVVELTC